MASLTAHGLLTIGSVRATLLSFEQLSKLAVLTIQPLWNGFNPLNPIENGMFSKKLGPFSEKNFDTCESCMHGPGECPGHFALMDTQQTPNFHPDMLPLLVQLFNMLCWNPERKCGLRLSGAGADPSTLASLRPSRRQAVESAARKFAQGVGLTGDRLADAAALITPFVTCFKCGKHQPSFRVLHKRLMVKEPGSKTLRPLRPREAFAALAKVSVEDLASIGLQPHVSHPAWAILRGMPVPPGSLFPPMTMQNQELAPDELHNHLGRIGAASAALVKLRVALTDVRANAALAGSEREDKAADLEIQILNKETDLQTMVNQLVSQSAAKKMNRRTGGFSRRGGRFRWINRSNRAAKAAAKAAATAAADAIAQATTDEERSAAIARAAGVPKYSKRTQLQSPHADTPGPIKLKSISERLNGKDGLVRSGMSSHINEHTFRTVIVDNPDIRNGDIGLPENILVTQTRDIFITPQNERLVAQLIANGPNVFPGARSITRADGTVTFLPDAPFESRQPSRTANHNVFSTSDRPSERGMAWRKKAREIRSKYRYSYGDSIQAHLCADMTIEEHLTVGRNPSISEGSIQGHRARRGGRHNCIEENGTSLRQKHADFDGDEEHGENNQLLRSQAESRMLMSTGYHNISSMDNSNQIELVHSGILAMFRLTSRDTFLTRDQFMQYLALFTYGRGDFKSAKTTLPFPAVVRIDTDRATGRKTRVERWTGAQLISQFLPMIPHYANSQDKMKLDTAGTPSTSSLPAQRSVLIRNGEWLHGQAGSAVFGNSPHSLFTYLYHYYPHAVHQRVATRLQHMGGVFLTDTGCSVGPADVEATAERMLPRQFRDEALRIAVDPSLSARIKIERIQAVHEAAAAERVRIERKQQDGATALTMLEESVICGSRIKLPGLMQMCVTMGPQRSGGTPWHGRPTPHFDESELRTEPLALYFVRERLLESMTDVSFFLHARVAREGSIASLDGVPKGGYLKRKLDRVSEEWVVEYDGTVRNPAGEILQFLFGEDGRNPKFGKRVSVPRVVAEPPDPTEDASSRAWQQWRALPPALRDVIAESGRRWQHGEERPDTVSVPVRVMDLVHAYARASVDASLSPDVVQRRIRRLCALLRAPRRTTRAELFACIDDDKRALPADTASDGVVTGTLMTEMEIERALAGQLHHFFNESQWRAFARAVLTEYLRAAAVPGSSPGSLMSAAVTAPLVQESMDVEHHVGHNAVVMASGLPLAEETYSATLNMGYPSVLIPISPVCLHCQFDAGVSVESCPHAQINRVKMSLRRSLQCIQLSRLGAKISVEDTETPETRDVDFDLLLFAQRPAARLSRAFLRVQIPHQDGDDDAVDQGDHHSRCVEYIKKLSAWLCGWKQMPFASAGEEKGARISVVDTGTAISNARVRLAIDYVARLYVVMPEGALSTEEDEAAVLSFWRQASGRVPHLVLAGVPNVTNVDTRSLPNAVRIGGQRKSKFAFMSAMALRPGVLSRYVVSNSVHEVLKLAGIEAAREFLVRQKTFIASKKPSDARFITFSADVMTRMGVISPFTRTSKDIKKAPLLKRSGFECNQKELSRAAWRGEIDYIEDITACTAVGKIAPIGTGKIRLRMNRQLLTESTPQVAREIPSYRRPAAATFKRPAAATQARPRSHPMIVTDNVFDRRRARPRVATQGKERVDISQTVSDNRRELSAMIAAIDQSAGSESGQEPDDAAPQLIMAPLPPDDAPVPITFMPAPPLVFPSAGAGAGARAVPMDVETEWD